MRRLRSVRRKVRSRWSRRGFTLVELLVVVGISTAGFVALAKLQTTSIQGARGTASMDQAVMLAENFLEDLRLELSQWTSTSSIQQLGPNTLPSLAELPAGGNIGAGAQTPGDGIPGAPGWVIAGDQGQNRLISIAGDLRTFDNVSGQQVTLNEGIRRAMTDPNIPTAGEKFCLRYRLTWLVPGKAIRAEVEVSWPYNPIDLQVLDTCAYFAAERLGEVRSVNLTTTIMTNLFRK